MTKDPVTEAVSFAWDQMIEHARKQGPKALRRAELMRKRADLLREHAFPVVAAEIYQIDLEIEGEKDTDENLEGWLWKTCPAGLRAEAREEIRKFRIRRPK